MVSHYSGSAAYPSSNTFIWGCGGGGTRGGDVL